MTHPSVTLPKRSYDQPLESTLSFDSLFYIPRKTEKNRRPSHHPSQSNNEGVLGPLVHLEGHSSSSSSQLITIPTMSIRNKRPSNRRPKRNHRLQSSDMHSSCILPATSTSLDRSVVLVEFSNDRKSQRRMKKHSPSPDALLSPCDIQRGSSTRRKEASTSLSASIRANNHPRHSRSNRLSSSSPAPRRGRTVGQSRLKRHSSKIESSFDCGQWVKRLTLPAFTIGSERIHSSSPGDPHIDLDRVSELECVICGLVGLNSIALNCFNGPRVPKRTRNPGYDRDFKMPQGHVFCVFCLSEWLHTQDGISFPISGRDPDTPITCCYCSKKSRPTLLLDINTLRVQCPHCHLWDGPFEAIVKHWRSDCHPNSLITCPFARFGCEEGDDRFRLDYSNPPLRFHPGLIDEHLLNYREHHLHLARDQAENDRMMRLMVTAIEQRTRDKFGQSRINLPRASASISPSSVASTTTSIDGFHFQLNTTAAREHSLSTMHAEHSNRDHTLPSQSSNLNVRPSSVNKSMKKFDRTMRGLGAMEETLSELNLSMTSVDSSREDENSLGVSSHSQLPGVRYLQEPDSCSHTPPDDKTPYNFSSSNGEGTLDAIVSHPSIPMMSEHRSFWNEQSTLKSRAPSYARSVDSWPLKEAELFGYRLTLNHTAPLILPAFISSPHDDFANQGCSCLEKFRIRMPKAHFEDQKRVDVTLPGLMCQGEDPLMPTFKNCREPDPPLLKGLPSNVGKYLRWLPQNLQGDPQMHCYVWDTHKGSQCPIPASLILFGGSLVDPSNGNRASTRRYPCHLIFLIHIISEKKAIHVELLTSLPTSFCVDDLTDVHRTESSGLILYTKSQVAYTIITDPFLVWRMNFRGSKDGL